MGFGWDERLKKGKVTKKCKTISNVGLGGMDDGKSESRTELQIISKVGLGGIRWDEWFKKWKYNRGAIFFKVGLGGMVDWKSEDQTELKKWKLCSG